MMTLSSINTQSSGQARSSVFKKTLLTALVALTISSPFAANANPSSEVIAIYNQAAQGNDDLIEEAYDRLNESLKTDGVMPLTLVYLGSVETMMGREAFLPWNKMKYVEQGLATIAKSLDLLKDIDAPLHEQERIKGLPETYLTRAMAAITYSSLPDMFNHFERGYDLFLSLLGEEQFKQQHFAATSWVYRYAIAAAIRAEDLPQANQWLAEMEMQDNKHPETLKAKALIEEIKQ